MTAIYIPISKSVKYLGGHLDSSLNFKEHIGKKCKAALINYQRIRSIRKFLTIETCTTLVLSLCISHLDYGNSLLFGLPWNTLNQLQRVQNMCAKLVLNRRKYDSNTDCLRELHWLPIEKRIEFKILTMVYNTIKGNAPNYLKSILKAKIIN